MRNYILLLSPLVQAANKERAHCTLPDLQSMALMPDFMENLAFGMLSCMTALQPLTADGLLGCLQEMARGANNPCIECMFQSIPAQLLTCSINCSMDPETEGCGACQVDLIVSVVGNCMPPGIASLVIGQLGNTNGTDISQIFGGLSGSVGGGHHHQRGSEESWGPNAGLRCSLSEMKKLVPRGRENIEIFVECVGNLPSPTDSWEPCLPSLEEVSSNTNCTACLDSVLVQVQTSCMDACGSGSDDGCRHCLSNVASMGLGLCTGVADPPVQAPCTAADSAMFAANNGQSTVLDCKNGNVSLDTCLGISSISAMSMGCLACVGTAPAWSTAEPQPCNCTLEMPPMRSNNPRMVCDDSCRERQVTFGALSAEHCFDPNGFRRPGDSTPEFGINETVAIFMPACSLDDIVTLSDAAGDITSCLDSSAPDVCMASVVTAETVCTECVVSTLPTTCDSSDCWDESLSTSVGTCLYSGFPIQALADRGSIDPTTESPKSATVARTALTIFIATSFLVYNLF